MTAAAETELDRLRALLADLDAVVWEMEASSGRLTFVSDHVSAMLGYDARELTDESTTWGSLVHPDDREWVVTALEDAQAEGRPSDLEYRLLARDGATVWVNHRGQSVLDPPGARRGVWMNVTERKLDEDRDRDEPEGVGLVDLDTMDETILQAVSHDLRTPIAAILGLATTLEREDLELTAEDQRDMTSRIVSNTRKLDRMVNDLLDLDRLSRGVMEPTITTTDVGSIVARVVAGSEVAADRVVEVDAPEITADLDVAKVERIVENLLANAARHAPDDSHIRVSAARDDASVVIAVDDEGPAVRAEDRTRIFEPFRRGPAGREHSLDVGVRLALVVGFAELLGGGAWVQDREGGGASFRVRLPLGRTVPPAGPPSG